MAVNVINPNKGRVYLSKEGLQLDSANLDKYHPNSNVNTLQVNIEDGGVLNTMAMINYQTPSMAVQSQAMTSHWYPLFFIGINNVKVANESGRRTFAQFLTPIPVNILNLNLGRSLPMNVKATVKLVGGVNFKGVFVKGELDSLEQLNNKLPPSKILDEEYAIACVIDKDGNVDYYQVDETSTNVYEWVKNSETTNPILSLLESKQYNIFNMSVQGGFGNATSLPLATQHYQILWQSINNQGNAISDLDNKVDNVLSFYQNLIQSVINTDTIATRIIDDFPNGKKLQIDVKISDSNDLIDVNEDGLAVTNLKIAERIDLKTNPIIQELDEHIEDLDNPHGVTAEQVDTYNKTTIDSKDANTLQQAKDYTYSRVEIDSKDTAIMNKANNLENANMFKDVNYNNVNGVLTFTKYDDTTKEIDLPLELIVTSGYYDEVTNELVLVLANGSEIRIPVGDLLTDLDAHNIRFNGSGTNYLVSKTDVESAVKELDTQVKNVNDLLGNKVDKVSGKGLSTNDYTNVDKNKVDLIETEGNGTKYFGDDGQYHDNSTIDELLGNLSTLGFVKRSGTNTYIIDTSTYQPLDDDLTSIAGLSGTNGFLKKTASNTWSLDTSVYLTSITKTMVETVLTGTITTHTHNASAIVEDATHRFVTDTEKSTWNAKQSALGFTPENQANKKTTLTDSDVDFPTTKAVKTAIDTAVSQTLKPMGNWNASTNTPTLTNSDVTKANEVYYVNVAGTQFGITFGVGDELVYNTNGVIFKRDNVDAVISVNGKEGVVVLTQDDVADGSTYKRVTETEKTTWNNKVTSNTAITGATKPKITYDSKGLVTGGADLVESDIPALSPTKITQNSTNRFVTDTEKSNWNNKIDESQLNLKFADNFGMLPFGTTSGTTSAYTLTISGITELKEGLVIAVKLHATNASSATLNLNSLGAKNIRKSASGSVAPTNITESQLAIQTVVLLTYDGTYWVYNDLNTTYSTITQSQIDAGTATTAVVITPKLLRDNFYTESEIDDMIGDIESVLDAILGV